MVAWQFIAWDTRTKEPSRRAGYKELSLASTLVRLRKPFEKWQIRSNQSCRTLRDGSLFSAYPRHFVPG